MLCKGVSLVLIIFVSLTYSFGQTTNILEPKHYQVSENVISVEMKTYPLSEEDTLALKPIQIQTVSFVDGYMDAMTEEHSRFNISHQYKIMDHKPRREFAMHYKRFKEEDVNIDSITEFKAVNYKGLIFFYPKKDHQIVRDEIFLNDRVEVSFTLDGKKEICWLEASTDSTITEIVYQGNGREMTYDKKGRLQEKLYPTNNRTTYYYNSHGDVVKTLFYNKIMNRSQSPPMVARYYYEYDTYGNWVQCLKIVETNLLQKAPNRLMTYMARKLNYKDGEETGSVLFDNLFVKQILKDIKHEN